MAKFGLGKGLGALIPEHQQYFDSSRNPADTGGIVSIIPLSRLKPNPDQPRKAFPDESIDELAESIRRHGLLQPILAEPAGNDEYIIVAGERRFRAALRAGLAEIPVIVRSVSTEKRLQISLIENIQREDLNPMEEAQAYHDLMEITGYTQEQVAEAVGKNRSTVANAMRLLKLSGPMRDAVTQGKISAGHARSLLAVAGEAEREALFSRIIAEGLSVRQTEAAVLVLGGGSDGSGRKQARRKSGGQAAELEPDLKAIRESLIERLGTKVEIRGTFGKGTISIEYYTPDDLQRILDFLGSGS